MTFRRLLFRNLFFHWRGNLAVFLGVAVGAAVLTGALLVGDSLRGSLRERTLRQLAGVEYALVGGHFVRADLANELGVPNAVPVVLLQGTVRGGADGSTRQAGPVAVWGVEERFGRVGPAVGDLAPGSALLSANLAAELGVAPGGSIRLQLQKVSSIPRESLLGQRGAEDLSSAVPLTVARVADAGDPVNSFSLNPSPEPPRNLFVPLAWLQKELGQPGRANAILIGAGADRLTQRLQEHLSLDDWGLTVEGPAERAARVFAQLDENHDGTLTGEELKKLAGAVVREADTNRDGRLTPAELAGWFDRHPYINLESRQLLLDPDTVAAARAAAAAEGVGLRPAETLVYLANDIAAGGRTVPYSLVAALDPGQAPPLGPFLPPGDPKPLADDEIVLVDWKRSPLKPNTGDSVTLRYYLPEVEGAVKTGEHTFRYRGPALPLEGPADDPYLTPEFPGLTDKAESDDWKPPFPIDTGRMRKDDKDYWRDHRTTPKAYITLATGQKLWGSARFGNVTSVRLAPADGSTPGPAALTARAEAFRRALLAKLDPQRGGLEFLPVRERGLRASRGGNDFGGLFLGFSCFLIAAALLLVGLLFRLNLERRAAELGLLLATGYPVRSVRRLLLGEGLLLASAGGLLGLAGAVGYAWLMVRLLVWLWPSEQVGSFLALHVTATSLLLGYAGALLCSLGAILGAVRVLRKVSPRALLDGETTPAADPSKPTGRRWGVRITAGALLGAGGLLPAGFFVQDHEMQAMTFFGGGALLLTAGLAAVWAWLKRSRPGRVSGRGVAALARLGARNAARNPLRSLLTTALLASAAFLLVAVELFRQQPGADFLARDAGSGGFSLFAEAALPLVRGPETPDGREELLLALEERYQAEQDAGGPPKGERLTAAEKALTASTIFPCRLKGGDDASCLNLYRVGQPRLLGVPAGLIDRGGFHFGDTEARTPEEKANPWLLLRREWPDQQVPVFGDQETVTWILKTGLGGTVPVEDERGRPVRLRIVGLLQGSIFQSELILSEAHFKELYPHQEGYSALLVATPPGEEREVADLLKTGLSAYGLSVTDTRARLAAYQAVRNTYLSTFQLLGGFGLLLGTLGLAVVLLRGVWERRGELALLRALGYRFRALGWLVLAENGALLLLGLGTGVGAALLAVAPHLAAGGGVSWLRLAAMLGLVLAAGLAAGALAVRATLRAPLLPALRRE